MITLLTSLWGLFGGGLMRLLPEVLGLLNKKTDNSHELAMMDKQIELQKLKAADDRAALVTQGEQERDTLAMKNDSAELLALLDAQKEALKGQMQKTGYYIVDVLNFLVRPVVTYGFLGLYWTVKVATIVLAWRQSNAWAAIIASWSQDDAAILTGILGFWFVGRVFDKKK